jgi:hypothetical protein
MRQLLFIATALLLSLSACQKNEEGIENVGTYGEQLAGFEGTISYAKDGKPVVGHPVRIQVGDQSAQVVFDPSTGSFTPVPISNKNAYAKEAVTDSKGQYRLVEESKNLPVRYGNFFAVIYSQTREFEYYYREYIVNGQSQEGKPMYDTQLDLGKIKKVDVKLYEAYNLTLTLLASDAELGDEVRTRGDLYSPVNGKANKLYSDLSVPLPTPTSLPFIYIASLHKSKPNVPITLTIELYRNKVLNSTRTVTVPMNQKETNINLL